MKHEVLVGNIGNVYQGNNGFKAAIAYHLYVKKSQDKDGRAAGESVTWFKNGHVKREYLGPLDPISGWVEYQDE